MIQTNICEHYAHSFSANTYLMPYNRSTAIEVRSIFCIPREIRDMLDCIKPLYPDIGLYTEDKKLIRSLNNMATREYNISNDANPVQMLIFCPITYLSEFLLRCKWIAETIILSTKSWYTVGLSTEAQHKIFCKEKCYHNKLQPRENCTMKTIPPTPLLNSTSDFPSLTN